MSVAHRDGRAHRGSAPASPRPVASFTTRAAASSEPRSKRPLRQRLSQARQHKCRPRRHLATVYWRAPRSRPHRTWHPVAQGTGPGAGRTLLEVHDRRQWLYFNPQTLEQGLPTDFYIWWRGDERIADIEGGSPPDVTLAVQQNLLDSMLVAERRAEKLGSRSMDFSLFSLPIATQAVYSVLLMIPIGALVILFLRNFVGVKTFGTFMPVLVALAFRETLLVWGIVLFVVIVALGLVIRFYLERLRLLLVPRLTVVLTVVVLLMAGISVLSQVGIQTGCRSRCPVVIIR